MTLTLPLPRVVVPNRVRTATATALADARLPGRLAAGGAGLLAVTAGLLTSLALLRTGNSFVARTVSVGVYGPYGELVPIALFAFGLGALALGAALRLRVGGRPGRICGRLVAVWGTASLIDAFVRTNRTGVHTPHGDAHITLAITGLVAQVIVVGYYLRVLRRRRGRVPVVAYAATAFVVAAGGFFAVQPPALDGLAERALFLSSAVWMVTSERLARRSRPD